MNRLLNTFIDDLLIVIVLYEMPLSSSKSWTSLMLHLQRPAAFFLWNNSTHVQAIPESRHQILYHHNSGNAGIAKAYNEGWKNAVRMNKHWLLLLDQDTEITGQLFTSYASAMGQYPDNLFFVPILKDKKGVVSPFYFQNGISTRIKMIKDSMMAFASYRAANSGSLINTKLFDLVNGYDERLPLDFSDVYFQEKISRHHPEFVTVTNELTHHFSGSEKQNKQVSLNRFTTFCESSLAMTELTGHKNNFYWNSLKRAVRLSINHFSMAFILLHLKIWRKK